jgi:predicted DNA-binding transcriptional regulator AlpA
MNPARRKPSSQEIANALRPAPARGDQRLHARLLTARQVGERLGLSPASVLRRWRAGTLPGYRIDSNVVRFDQLEVDAWLRNRRGTLAPVNDDGSTGASRAKR